MNDQELAILLNDLESDRVERKASIADRNIIRQAICAFANDLPNHQQPGVLFIGVNNDGTCANLPITDQFLLTLSDIRSDGNILPFPCMIVQKRTISGCELVVVIVEPSDDPPVRFNGRIWVRVGPRRATATRQEERRLAEKRRAKDLPFDILPLPSASLDDLDLDLFRRVYLPSSLAIDILEENERSIEQQLTSMRFATVEPQPKPTVLGVLVVGSDPRQFLPGAYIQFLRIDGSELTDPIKDQKEIGGSLPDLLRILDATLQAHISIATDITAQPIEMRQPDYPIVALQQLTRNAVMHRIYEGTYAPVRITWFNDRIEIQNPGGPFGQVTKQNFGQPGVTDYRNPHLAEAMKNLGYVQRFGVGIQLARKELQKNGNPPLEFVVEDAHLLVTLKKKP
ncbi:MAG: ATP-binding protein [Coleofasciculus chthonoplastes F3-SA18-01]|jgi:ATP-dependent DNA helicase RecG|uniref:ATP-binding protein n=1 Tax=Coleofasciculus chthonoplastes TaxID=64178 RepID=UPI0032F1E78D